MSSSLAGNDEAPIVAVCNLVGALIGQLAIAGIPKANLEAALTLFDQLNASTIPAGPARERLEQATRLQRGILAQLP